MDSQRTPNVQGYKASAEMHLDLRRPPTPDQVGMLPGRDDMIVDRVDDRYLDVDLTLPDAGRLHVPAIAVNFVVDEPENDTLNEIIVNQVVAGLPEAADAVLSAGLGVDQAQMHEYVRDQGRKAKDDRLSHIFYGWRFGYLQSSAELRPNARTGKVLINYSLLWQGPVRKPPSAPNV